jgi:hypothetical protein
MLSRSFNPFIYAQNFMGVNAKDSPENFLDGEWDQSSINVFSDPQGAVASRPGFTALTTTSIGSATAWCGFYQFIKHVSGTTSNYYIGAGSDGKLYSYASSAYNLLFTGLQTGIDVRWSFFTLGNQVICANGYSVLAWAGTGSAATFATSVTADFGIEWQRYGWLHSTVDPRLMYYSTIDDPDSAYTSFLNFDTDSYAVSGSCKQGDDMIIGKQFSLYRVQYRGTSPLFRIYRIPSSVGPVCFSVFKELPDGRNIFLAPDCNFYMLSGDNVEPVGSNIQPYVKLGVFSRLNKAVSGLCLNRSQYWCSFTYTSGATANDRTLVMDWSRPYADKWGKRQYPWFIYSIASNCFAEITLSGQAWLYHGGYVGKMYKDDNGTNDDGSSFNATYRATKRSHGEPTLEKKYDHFALSYARKGDWDLSVQLICDGNALTEKNITYDMLGGLGYQSLFDVAKFDEDYFSSESDTDSTREICRQGKTIEVSFGTTGLNESFLVYNYALHAKPLRRGVRTRESG